MSIATIWANDPSCHRILLLRPYRRYRRWSRLLERRRLQKFASRKFSSNKKSKTFFESQVWKKILYTKSLLRSWLWLIFFTKTFRTFPAVAAKNRRYQFRPLHLEKPFLADLAAFGAPEKIDNGKSVTKTNKQTNKRPAFCADSSITGSLGGTSDTSSQFQWQKTEAQSGLDGLLSRFSTKGCSLLSCWVRWSPCCLAPESGWSSSVVAACRCCCSLICSWSCFTSCWSSASCRVVKPPERIAKRTRLPQDTWKVERKGF